MDKKMATPVPEWPLAESAALLDCEHEDAIAALRLDLVVAAGRDGGLAADRSPL
jgi:hypothetical protein